MFRNPINAFPYANAVDITTNGNILPISFNFQGDVLRQWCVEIRDNDNDTIYYTSPVQNNISSPKYNGDICSVTLTVGSGGFIATTDNNFSWSVYMNDSTTSLTTTQIVTASDTYQSNEFYFINCDTPKANFTFTGATYDGTTCSLSQNILEVTGDYQSETPLKYYQVTIYAGDDIIAQSERMFTQNITFEYSGFDYTVTGDPSAPVVEGYNNYSIEIVLVNQFDLTNVYNIPIDLTNMLNQITDLDIANLVVYPQCNSSKTYNTITWAGTQVITGKATGDYTLIDEEQPSVPDRTRVQINSGEITYDNVSGTPLIVPNEDNCGLSFVVTIPLEIANKKATTHAQRTNIAKISLTEGATVNRTYTFSCANGYIYCVWQQPFILTTQGIITTDITNLTQKFAIQPLFEDNIDYRWYDDTTHTWQNNDTTYWFIDSVATVQIVINTQENVSPSHFQPDIIRMEILEVNN